MSEEFSSPREEALRIASQTRRNILERKGDDAVSILRACLVVAQILDKDPEKNWIMKELSGYAAEDKLPEYRTITCYFEEEEGDEKGREHLDLCVPVHVLLLHLDNKVELIVRAEEKRYHVTLSHLTFVLSSIVDKSLFFLNDVIRELQYGGIIEFLMEEIRKKTDQKLAKLDTKIFAETQSLSLNLRSTNPADWNKVGHSCRKLLKLVADKVFPPQNQPYVTKDKKPIEVNDSKYINRLCAFLDQKTEGDERRFLISEMKYLDEVVDYTQMVEHVASVEKINADLVAVHTYLILAEILRHTED